MDTCKNSVVFPHFAYHGALAEYIIPHKSTVLFTRIVPCSSYPTSKAQIILGTPISEW